MPEALLALIRSVPLLQDSPSWVFDSQSVYFRQHQVSQRLAAPSLAILRHLVQAGTAQGQYCLQAGLLPGLLTLLARDDVTCCSLQAGT
jgi:hypothetical protein